MQGRNLVQYSIVRQPGQAREELGAVGQLRAGKGRTQRSIAALGLAGEELQGFVIQKARVRQF